MKQNTPQPEWAVVQRCFRLPEAQIIKSILEGEGIEVFLPDEHLLGIEPGAETALGGARVMVHAADLDRAREVMSAMRDTENRTSDGVD